MSNDPKTEFRCRTCGDTKLIETMEGVVVSSECRLTVDGIEYGEQTNEDGEVCGYQCGNGHNVMGKDGGPITEEADLLDLFSNNPVLTHDDVVEVIADQLRQLDAESLVLEYERAFPAPKLKSLGDSLYVLERGDNDVSSNKTD